MIEIRLFGQAVVSNDGSPIKFPKRDTAIAIIAYLILHGGRAISRHLLAFTLFPELDEETALRETRRYVYLVQKTLPASVEPWIQADGEAIAWNFGAPAWIDAVEFARLAALPESMERAVEVYRGDLLVDVYEDWVVAERERLRSIYLDTLGVLVARARSERRYGAAIAFARRILVEDPWREDVVRQIMAARYESGDGAGALAEYERFRRSAVDELHTEPMAETRALKEIIAAGSPLPTRLEAGSVPRADRDGLPFIGRTREWERLRHAWERAARGNGALVTIEGEAGVGKSRLAAELALLVEREGGRAVLGMTGSPESVPYQCVIDALRAARQLLEALPKDRVRSAILARVLPELRSPDDALVPPLEASREQVRLFDAIALTVHGLARSRPLLVVLEDIHWSSRATLELLRALARRIASIPVLIVATFREEEVGLDHPLRVMQRELIAEHSALRLSLGPLERDEVASLVTSLGRNGAVDVDDLYERSEGNPLLLDELLHEPSDRDAWSASTRADAVLERKIDRLSRGARAYAAAAAVCGTAFDADVASAVAGLGGAESRAAEEELIDRRVIRGRVGAGGFEYAFTHHLIAARLYAALDAKDAKALHARASSVCARVYAERLDLVAGEIARHLTAAEDRAAAAPWFARAAHSAAAVFAYDASARYAQAAIESAPDSSELLEMLLLHADASGMQGWIDEQRRDFERIATLPLTPDERCDVLERKIKMLHALDDRARERACVADLREAALQAGNRPYQALADCAEAALEISMGHVAAARAPAERARAAEGIPPSIRTRALSLLAEIEVTSGEAERAASLIVDALERAEEAHDAALLSATLAQALAVALSRQEFARALDYGQRAEELYRTHGDRIGEARAAAGTASALLRLGRLREAREANLRAVHVFEAAGDLHGLARVMLNLGTLHARCGDLAYSRECIARARAWQIRVGDDRARTAAALNESFVLLWLGKPQQAKTLASEALETARAIDHAGYTAQAFANLGAAERDLGELDAAIAHMREGLDLQLALGRRADAVSDLADLALAVWQRGDLVEASALAERVLELDRVSASESIFPPFPSWVAARIFEDAGDSRAQPALARAATLADEHAAAIDDPKLRRSFDAFRLIVDIRKAVARGV